MDSKLCSTDRDLRDLAHGEPLLLDAFGQSTGIRLKKWLGAGGMASVFAAVFESREPESGLTHMTPHNIAVKILKPSTLEDAERCGIDAFHFFIKEAAALGRIMDRYPPTEFVVGYFGSGGVPIEVDGKTLHLPWIAIELVGGGPDGVTLTERVIRVSNEGVDPLRAYRLIQGIFAGVERLHEEGIIHRDLKPDNVLVAGPIDDETPKVSDCGIAAIPDLAGTIAAFTPEYAAPEQVLSVPGERNPLIGPWTDLHALSAVVWFVLAGDTWCPDPRDPGWRAGIRRSLAAGPHLHRGFLLDPSLPSRIDAVLARGAAHRLPEIAYQREGAENYRTVARARIPSMERGAEPRFETLAELRAALFPLLEKCISDWQAWCSVHQHSPTAFRSTRRLGTLVGDQPLCQIRQIERVHRSPYRPPSADPATWAHPRDIVFRPDGRVLARFGDSLAYFSEDHVRAVKVPESDRAQIPESRWLTRGPMGGFAVVGPEHIIMISYGGVSRMPLPCRKDGSVVGRIQSVVYGTAGLGVVTEETDDSNGGPELWLSLDGGSWDGPVVLPLNGDPVAVASSPAGYLVAGSRRNRARALFLPLDRHAVVYTSGVLERSPLCVAVCGGGQDRWAAGDGYILQLQRSAVVQELSDVIAPPQAMALDPVGNPWLLTENAVLRRHVEGGKPRWVVYHQKDPSTPPWIGVGFTGEGAQVMDARGFATRIIPRDINFWNRG